jgi:subtilisin family serine protease
MIRIICSEVVLLAVVLNTTALEAQPEFTPGPLNTYIVQVTEGSDPAQVGRGIVQRTRGKLGHVYKNAVRGFSVQLPPGLAKKAIEAQSGVLLVEPDVPVYAVAQILPTGIDRIEADNSDATTPVDVDIALIDTGIDIDHPDLNVVGGRHFYSLWGFLSFEDDLYDDDNGHGSHCAGIAAARNNDFGVVGVAPGARLWAVKVLDSTGSGYLSDVIAGLDWVTARASTIEVANMSLVATASSSIFRTAIQNSVGSGVVCVVAAGNDAKDVYGFDGVFGTSDDVIPAAYPEAATISAMVDSDGFPGGLGDSTGYGSDDSFANFSNDSHSVVAGNPVTSPGKAIDLLMPGVNIYSCYMNGGYATGSGTSMASPHAAGLVALYIAGNGRATNADGVYYIRQVLINEGVAQDSELGLFLQNDFDGNKENIGWAGSTEPQPPTDDPPSVMITNPADGAIVYGSVTIIADASDDMGITQVEFFIDGESIGVDVDGADGWSANWDTTEDPDGEHTVSATATDTIGQTSDDSIVVMIDNVIDTPPSVTITNPTEGSTVSGSVTVTADASDDAGVSQVEFFIDGGSIGVDADGADGWSVLWNTILYSNGSHTVLATATDTSAQTSSDSIETIVDNAQAPRIAQVDVMAIPLLSYRRWWVATAMVTVAEDGIPVAGATVEGLWSGLYNKAASNTTDGFGFISFETNWLRKAGTVTFTVTKVIAPDGEEYVLDPPEPSSSTTGP